MTAANGALPGFSDRVLRVPGAGRAPNRENRLRAGGRVSVEIRGVRAKRTDGGPIRPQAVRCAIRQRCECLDHNDFRRRRTGGDDQTESGKGRGFRPAQYGRLSRCGRRQDCVRDTLSSKQPGWRRISKSRARIRKWPMSRCGQDTWPHRTSTSISPLPRHASSTWRSTVEYCSSVHGVRRALIPG